MKLSKANLSLHLATSKPFTDWSQETNPLQYLYLDTEKHRVLASNGQFLVASTVAPDTDTDTDTVTPDTATPCEPSMFLHSTEAKALHRTADNSTARNRNPKTTNVSYAHKNPTPLTKVEPLTIEQGKRYTVVRQPVAVQYPDVGIISHAAASDTPLTTIMSLQSLEDLLALVKVHDAKEVFMQVIEPRQPIKFQTPRNSDQQFTAYIMPCIL